jgi:hypothetical protein
MKDFNITLFSKTSISIFVFFFIVGLHTVDAQRFKGSAVFGLNLAQIDGDDLAGYNKLGLTGGVKLAYPIRDNVDINMELLFSQRGSNDGFGFGNMGDNYTDLRYLEIPVYANIMDWFVPKEGYHKVKAHAGLNFSYLFAVDSSNGAVSNDIDTYKRNNIGYLIGVDYSFTKHLGASLRYNRAFNSILDSNAISYWVTVRTEYTF